jgi:hypothetical protein
MRALTTRYLTHIYTEHAKYALLNSRLALGRSPIKLNYQRVMAVHFPKAGGTSLRIQLGNLLGSGLALDYLNAPLSSRVERRDFPRGKQMVFGHFHPARFDETCGFRMTFLRHPIDTMISHYVFWKKLPYRGERTHARFLKEKPSILEFCLYGGLNCLMSETYFGGFDMRRFDFIGFEETRSRDLVRLGEMLGVSLCPNVHLNPTAYEEEIVLRNDASLRRNIGDLLRQDVSFYEKTQCL